MENATNQQVRVTDEYGAEPPAVYPIAEIELSDEERAELIRERVINVGGGAGVMFTLAIVE